jgi:protein arginine N-methyltransferase 1
MDICNKLSPKKFASADDFLTFISIYEDKKRERAYKKLLAAQQDSIRGKVCVEAGCGMGIFSEYLARLGAKKVFAVEVNPLMARLVGERLAGSRVIEVVEADIAAFDPGEKIDVLVHDFYGQLLFDEELHLLENLRFTPRRVLPDGGKLLCGVTTLKGRHDPVITPSILKRLDGILVSGLFDEGRLPLQFEVAGWRYGRKMRRDFEGSLPARKGDLLYLGIEVTHRGQRVCRSGECPNWSYVWTWRRANRFSLSFEDQGRTREPVFRWLDGRS